MNTAAISYLLATLEHSGFEAGQSSVCCCLLLISLFAESKQSWVLGTPNLPVQIPQTKPGIYALEDWPPSLNHRENCTDWVIAPRQQTLRCKAHKRRKGSHKAWRQRGINFRRQHLGIVISRILNWPSKIPPPISWTVNMMRYHAHDYAAFGGKKNILFIFIFLFYSINQFYQTLLL